MTGHDLFDTGRSGLRDPRVTFRQKQQNTIIGCGEVGEVQLAIFRVIQPSHRRLVARNHDLAQHLETLLHVLQRPAEEDVVLGHVGEQLDRHLGDETQRALVADDDVADVGAGGSAGDVLDSRYLSTRENDLTADDHVLDAAIQCRELADRAGGHQAAHAGDRL